MQIQTLISTMNLPDHDALTKRMNIGEHSITINQLTKTSDEGCVSLNDTNHVLRNYHERGLSRSRNRALDAAQADICVVADDDMRYEDNYEDAIIKTYSEIPSADIIVFHVDSDDPRQSKKILKFGRLNRITSMKVASWQITIRRESVMATEIRFDENFGTGTQNYMGEENIFLYDCIRKGLKVYYVPLKIARLNDQADSTWFEGYTKKYFVVKGSVYRRMSKLLWVIYILQFAIRKRSKYKNEASLLSAIFYMTKGALS